MTCMRTAFAPALTRFLALVALLLHAAVWAQEPAPPPSAMPTWAELEAAGAKVGEIRILNREIFDTDDPKEDYLLFRWANKLHVQTQASVIERALLFKTGEALSVRVLEETERVLRSSRYLYDVQFRAAALHDGVVDIEVTTRDTWSLDLGFSVGRSGGANSSGIGIKEYNLFGTGVSVSFGRSNNVDRSGNEFRVSNDRAFGTWTALNYTHATNSDGRLDAASVVRPFYELDAKWAAGALASKDNRINAVYNAGNVVSEYRHRQSRGEVFGGSSPGLVDGWAERYSLGVSYLDDAYANEAGRVAPAQLPMDEKLVAPFVRFELIEDRFDRQMNRNLIGRPEFFALGLATTVQLGRATTALGSSRDSWLYSGSISRGFEPAPDHTLIPSAAVSGQYAEGQVQRQHLGAQAQYYLHQNKRWLFFASAAGDMLTNPDAVDMLMLGGENGLRGYPLRYQSGTRRALVTTEERFYTDLYIWQLFRIGGAAFFDIGRAWGGDNVNVANPGWLRDVGFGLRIVSARSAFSNVLHVDIAFPLDATPDIKKVQFLVKSKTSF